jgi:amino acid adenylation domain-containing protein
VSPSSFHGIQDLVEHWYRRTPDVCAVRDPLTAQDLSYAQLWRRSGRLAGNLVDAGARPGEVVAVRLGRSIDLIVAMLGIIRAGAAYLPLDQNAPVERQAGMLLDARAQAIVMPGDRKDAPPVDNLRVLAVPPDTVPLDTGADDAPDLPAGPGGDDPIYVMYTSGSTGRPKGVVIPHRGVVRLVVEPDYCTFNAGDRVANGSNPAFDASTFEIWGPLAAGATVVVFPAITEIGIDDWETLICREQVDTAFLTTALFHTVARERPDVFTGLATLITGGEQLEVGAVRRVLAAGPPGRLVNAYGPTEATAIATYFDCTPESIAGHDRIPIGYPVRETNVYVLDDQLCEVPVGASGELCVAGPGVALGYRNRPDLTAERFVSDPRLGVLYRTGDLARQHRDGTLEVLGRRDRQVKLRGFRIELEEIERAATGTGLVDAAFAEKVGDGASAVLIGFVLPVSGAESGDLGRELSHRLARHLPEYMIPGRWVVLERLPLSPTGKVDRAELLALLRQAATADGPRPDEAVGPLVERVRALWQDVLGPASVSDGDNFLDLGGNSIAAVQLAARIEQRLGVRVEPAEILVAASFAKFTAELGTVLADNAVGSAR